MTDTSEQAPVEEAPAFVVPPEVQAAIDAVRAETAARQAAEAQAIQAEEDRVDKLNAIKAKHAAVADPIVTAIYAATDDRERKALEDLLHRTVEPYAVELAAAYQEFSGMRDGDSNPVPEGGTGQLSAHITVLGDTSAGTAEG